MLSSRVVSQMSGNNSGVRFKRTGSHQQQRPDNWCHGEIAFEIPAKDCLWRSDGFDKLGREHYWKSVLRRCSNLDWIARQLFHVRVGALDPTLWKLHVDWLMLVIVRLVDTSSQWLMLATCGWCQLGKVIWRPTMVATMTSCQRLPISWPICRLFSSHQNTLGQRPAGCVCYTTTGSSHVLPRLTD